MPNFIRMPLCSLKPDHNVLKYAAWGNLRYLLLPCKIEKQLFSFFFFLVTFQHFWSQDCMHQKKKLINDDYIDFCTIKEFQLFFSQSLIQFFSYRDHASPRNICSVELYVCTFSLWHEWTRAKRGELIIQLIIFPFG